MRIETAGAILIGTILFTAGTAILTSDIDPNMLCFKQCNIQRIIAAAFGEGLARAISGLAFSVIGAAFLVGAYRASSRNRKLDRSEK